MFEGVGRGRRVGEQEALQEAEWVEGVPFVVVG